jgi:uncharacterized membrane protein (DUF485 family)
MARFDAQNPMQVAGSFGGLVFMASALAYNGAIVLLQSYPLYVLLAAEERGFPAWKVVAWVGSLGVVAPVLLAAGMGGWAMRRGARALEEREY